MLLWGFQFRGVTDVEGQDVSLNTRRSGAEIPIRIGQHGTSYPNPAATNGL